MLNGGIDLRRTYLDELLPLLAAIALCAGLLLAIPNFTNAAQNPPPPAPTDEPPGAAPAPPPGKKPADKNKDTATSNAPDQPVWDPARADKDLKVGRYY